MPIFPSTVPDNADIYCSAIALVESIGTFDDIFDIILINAHTRNFEILVIITHRGIGRFIHLYLSQMNASSVRGSNNKLGLWVALLGSQNK